MKPRRTPFRRFLVAGYRRAWAKYKAIGMVGRNCRGRWVRSWYRYEVLRESGVFLPKIKSGAAKTP